MRTGPTKISCPHCGHAKKLSYDKIPKRAVGATCPKCAQHFLFDPALALPKRGIMETELFRFYSTIVKQQKNNAALIVTIFILYGLMYSSTTSAYYLYLKVYHGYLGEMFDFIQGCFLYALFFPVVIMHSWDYIAQDSRHIADRLHSHNAIFFIVFVSYLLLLAATALCFENGEMPLALILPVMISSMIPSALHVYRHRNERLFFD